MNTQGFDMKYVISNRIKLIVAIIISLGLVVAVVLYVLTTTTNQPKTNSGISSDGDNSTVVNNDSSNPNEQNSSDDNPASPADEDVPSANNLPMAVGVCGDDTIVGNSFTLAMPASVYMTALDAKNKTNPSLTYQPGQYFVFKCFDGMANITHTQGVPGGWIDPINPYQKPAISNQVPNSTPGNTVAPLNVMTFDNTTVNWSHEYPAAFVKDYNGFWNISLGNLYLTFDCGYDYNNLAASIMDTLKIKGVKAVFFVTGDFMNDRPDLVRRMVDEGHRVGNHSYAHLNQPQNLTTNTDIVTADIREWETAYRNIMGSNPSVAYFRPPAGAISKRSMALMNQLGYKTLMWGAAYKDWDTSAQLSKDEAMALLRKYTTSGDVVLLHGISQTSNDILSQYIDEYRGKGLVFALP